MEINQTRMMPLRYRISDFRQLNKCMSNNSRDLSIHVSAIVNDKNLNGQRISVNHKKYGVLFACIRDAQGCMISKDVEGNSFHEFTTGEILDELKKFGFLIEYDPIEHISGNQLEFLMTLNNLHYDKIRVLSVWDAPLGTKEFKTHVVAFLAEAHGDWLNAGYSPSISEFTHGLQNGTAFDISAISKAQDYDWSWLVGWVGSISDILAENSGVGE